MNARMKQQGGLAGSFVIIGIVLALLFVGGVYFLKSNEVNNKLASDKDASSSQNEADQSQKGQNTQSEDQAKKEKDTDAQAQEGTKEVDEKTTDSAAKSHEATESDNAHAELPQTGPADTAATLAVFAILSYSIAAYVRSRGRLTL